MGLPITITPSPQLWRLTLGDLVLGQSATALVLEEAGHGPVLYVPRQDIDMSLLIPSTRQTSCPWKGEARYFSIGAHQDVVWSYETPIQAMDAITGHLAFYPVVTAEALANP